MEDGLGLLGAGVAVHDGDRHLTVASVDGFSDNLLSLARVVEHDLPRSTRTTRDGHAIDSLQRFESRFHLGGAGIMSQWPSCVAVKRECESSFRCIVQDLLDFVSVHGTVLDGNDIDTGGIKCGISLAENRQSRAVRIKSNHPGLAVAALHNHAARGLNRREAVERSLNVAGRRVKGYESCAFEPEVESQVPGCGVVGDSLNVADHAGHSKPRPCRIDGRIEERKERKGILKNGVPPRSDG